MIELDPYAHDSPDYLRELRAQDPPDKPRTEYLTVTPSGIKPWDPDEPQPDRYPFPQ